MSHFKTTLLALAAGLALAACGGGSSTADTTPRVNITKVKSFGDSLADSGTFGYKFTVQGATPTTPVVYPERIAASYGQTLCPFFTYTPTAASPFTPNPACTNFAIGGGVINPASSSSAAGAGNPIGIQAQLAVAGSLGFSATDLAVIDGGGNDIAALATAYLQASQDGGASLLALLSSLLPAQQVGAALQGGASTTAAIGVTYMQTLADALATSVTTNVLGKGGQQVVILNMPDVVYTPKFQGVLAYITATQGATTATQVTTVLRTWMQAYNTELASKFASESRVVVVDFFTAFDNQFNNPTQFGLTDVKDEVCPVVAPNVDSDSNFSTCTAAALSAHPPSGVTNPNWWQTYAFANSFHPTPYGHQLTGQLISTALAVKGWL